LAGAAWFNWAVTAEEVQLEAREQQVAAQLQQIAQGRSLFEQEYLAQTQRLQLREQTLSQRLATYHEWLEFPLPTNLVESAPELPPNDTELAAFLKKDAALQQLLQSETEALFERIRTNYYAPEGQFQLALLRDDLLQLMTRCAQIYQPQVAQPLLETSLERLLRAWSRTGLQLLVVLDNMPVELHTYNLNRMYQAVRQAVTAYGAYQAVRPYWGYANTAFYVGRLAMGANPLSLGAWWFLSTLGKEGAQALASRLLHRHALAMLQDMVRVIGYEVAATYGGDFRHRDANWIYAAELTELIASFPLSRDSLQHALKEIGALTLRSEYDRMFLTRCLAIGKSAKPEQFHSAQLLTTTERRAIAQRLEKFLVAYIHGKSPKRVQAWQSGVESRLELKLSVEGVKTSTSRDGQLYEACCSLLGFLTAIKQFEAIEALRLIPHSRVWQELSSEARTRFSQEMLSQAPYYFAEPDLDPTGDVVAPFLDDLATFAARHPPRGDDMLELLRDCSLYLRQTERSAVERWSKQIETVLRERSAASTMIKGLTLSVMQAVLDLLGSEQLIFLYQNVSIKEAPNMANLWLLGTTERIVLFAVENKEPRAYWTADETLTLETQRGIVTRDVLLRGGKWLLSAEKTWTIRVPGPLLTGSELYFQPLFAFRPPVLPNTPASSS
jgi:hypothetical protein